ncbi:MAG: hypothetical protein HFJ50_06680 [Clostridia bacterium]|jgi:hypothetical protein|nr:hypothetical protein [Clostridia bacterium]
MDFHGKGSISANKSLLRLGVSKVTVKLTAEDGSEEIRYIDIIQLSDEIGIESVEVDDILITENEAGNYETTVSDKVDISKIKVVLKSNTSKISIDGKNEALHETQIEIRKGTNRRLDIPLKVTAEDGTTFIYTLTLNIISNDNSVKEVNVNNEKAKLQDNKYIAYIGKYEEEANIEIIANSEYAEVTKEEITGKERIEFKLDSNDLTKEEFEINFKITSEDGEEKEYILICKRKSDDSTIKQVFVEDIEVMPNVSHPVYKDGTYYKTCTVDGAPVKVVANDENATVSFNGNIGTHQLEQIIELSKTEKVTEVPVTITSQEGNTYETVIYIERVSNNNKLLILKVNSEEPEASKEENTFSKYIYDTVESVEIYIEAEDEASSIILTDEERKFSIK